MSLEHAILGLLAAGPQTGYDLKTRCFDDTLSFAWTADQAQIYRTLDKLLTRKLVASKLIPQRGKPDRRVYSITENGREALSEWLASAIDIPSPRDSLLLRLQFAGEMPAEDLRRVLEDVRARYQKRVDALTARLDAKTPTDSDPCPPLGGARGAALRRLAMERALESERDTVKWLTECIDSVTSGPVPAKRGTGKRT